MYKSNNGYICRLTDMTLVRNSGLLIYTFKLDLFLSKLVKTILLEETRQKLLSRAVPNLTISECLYLLRLGYEDRKLQIRSKRCHWYQQ